MDIFDKITFSAQAKRNDDKFKGVPLDVSSREKCHIHFPNII